MATPPCNASGITYSPNAFAPNEPIILNFKMNSANLLETLRGKKVRLSVTQRLWWNYQTKSTTVTSDSFSLTVDHDIPVIRDSQSPGTHTAVLDVLQSDGIWNEQCSGIIYTIGDPKTCVIDPRLESKIPPDTKLTIKFSGKPREKYNLYYDLRGSVPKLAEATTDNNGQGEFKDVKIPGTNGDTINLKVGDNKTGAAKPYCSKQIAIQFNAPQPGPPSTEPVPIAAPGTTTGPGGQPTKPAGPPTVSGGIPCGAGDSGVQTAIGCIHTNPAEFAKDILKFAIGIGGGLAFLMMLLGAFQMLTSAGNPDSLKAGQDRLTSAVIGLLFVIFAVLFLQIIGANILGLPDFKP